MHNCWYNHLNTGIPSGLTSADGVASDNDDKGRGVLFMKDFWFLSRMKPTISLLRVVGPRPYKSQTEYYYFLRLPMF